MDEEVAKIGNREWSHGTTISTPNWKNSKAES
jgi:hypothetical protein